jgi:hypothetical protein
MKKEISILAFVMLAFATLALSSASYAQCTGCKIFAVTNDDNPATGLNTATVFGYPATGNIIGVSQTLHTGGTGIGGGDFALTRVATATDDKCLFVSDPGASTGFPFGDIAGFPGSPGFYGATPFRIASQDTGLSFYGIGLAVTPSGKYLFATLDFSNTIETFKVAASTCKLTPVHNITAVADIVGPLAVSSDGKVLIIPGVTDSAVTAYRIGPTGGLTLINTFNLLPVSSCTTPGCFPTGVDISEVQSNIATVAIGNATPSAPDYITCDLNTIALVALTACTNNTIAGPGSSLTNVENPFYNKFGYSATGGIYMGASGDNTGFPCGVSLNPAGPAGVVGAISSGAYQQPASTVYCSNAQSYSASATQQYVWQSGVTSGAVNTMYLYKSNGIVVVPFRSLLNPNANGSQSNIVLSLQALNQAGIQTR